MSDMVAGNAFLPVLFLRHAPQWSSAASRRTGPGSLPSTKLPKPHLVVHAKRQVGNQPLQPNVLIAQLAQLAQLADLGRTEAAVLLFPRYIVFSWTNIGGTRSIKRGDERAAGASAGLKCHRTSRLDSAENGINSPKGGQMDGGSRMAVRG
jgi:hypothetical protein